MPLSAKAMRDRALARAQDITSQEIVDINSASSFSIVCDELSDVDDMHKSIFLAGMSALKAHKKNSLTCCLSLVKLEVRIFFQQLQLKESRIQINHIFFCRN